MFITDLPAALDISGMEQAGPSGLQRKQPCRFPSEEQAKRRCDSDSSTHSSSSDAEDGQCLLV